jgi:hypothetical protein
MSIIKNYHDKKWTLQFLDALYISIDMPLKNDFFLIFEIVYNNNNIMLHGENCFIVKIGCFVL